jgi:hypothetical protein
MKICDILNWFPKDISQDRSHCTYIYIPIQKLWNVIIQINGPRIYFSNDTNEINGPKMYFSNDTNEINGPQIYFSNDINEE